MLVHLSQNLASSSTLTSLQHRLEGENDGKLINRDAIPLLLLSCHPLQWNHFDGVRALYLGTHTSVDHVGRVLGRDTYTTTT